VHWREKERTIMREKRKRKRKRKTPEYQGHRESEKQWSLGALPEESERERETELQREFKAVVEIETERKGVVQRKKRGTSIKDRESERMREVKHCRVVVESSSHYSRLGGLPETGHSESHRRQRFHLSDRTIEPFFEPITALIGALNDKLSLQQKKFIAIVCHLIFKLVVE